MILFLITTLLMRPPDKTAVFSIQDNSILVNGETTVTWKNEIAIGKSRVRVNKDDYSIIFDFRLQLYIYIDHEKKQYQISNSSTRKNHLRRPLIGLAPIVNGLLEHTSSYITKLNKRKIVQGFPCQAYQLNYPEHMGIQTVLWTFPHPVLSSPEYRRLLYSLLGSDIPGDAKYVLGNILRELWGTPLAIHTTMEMGEDKVEMVSAFSYIELRENTDYQLFEIPKGYSMVKRTDE